VAAPQIDIDSDDLVAPRHFAEHGYPHDHWKLLRAQAPVHFFERSQGRSFWAITKHSDITWIGKNPQLFLNGPELVVPHRDRTEDGFNPPPTLIQMDPPVHGAQRKLISKRFTPRALERIHPDIERISKKIIDDMLEGGDEGECDFVEKVSAPLPIAVIAWLLGVPESDWRLLFDWTNSVLGAEDPEYQTAGQDSDATAQKAMVELFTYFTKLVEEKRKNPADDLVTLFTNAEVEGRKLEPMEVLSWCLIIVIAGNETTRNATSGGMLALIEHPDQLAILQRDPSQLKHGIEEIVRWTSPIIHFARTASRDVELRGQKIREGDLLSLFYPSANRDEEVFDRPYEFDVTRNPNRHIGFGVGEHFCAGAHVARLELEAAYKHLLPRIEEIELAGPVDRLHSHLVGGVKRLPIRYKLRPE